MALSNTERQKQWLEKNRALHNFRRRNHRKTIGVPVERFESVVGSTPAAPSSKSKIEELRELITKESEKPVETHVAVPTVFKDDYGRVTSETQWKRLQERKETAKAGGYEIDDYSQ